MLSSTPQAQGQATTSAANAAEYSEAAAAANEAYGRSPDDGARNMSIKSPSSDLRVQEAYGGVEPSSAKQEAAEEEEKQGGAELLAEI